MSEETKEEFDCETCVYYDDEKGGCPFVDGCQYEPKPPEGYITIRE